MACKYGKLKNPHGRRKCRKRPRHGGGGHRRRHGGRRRGGAVRGRRCLRFGRSHGRRVCRRWSRRRRRGRGYGMIDVDWAQD